MKTYKDTMNELEKLNNSLDLWTFLEQKVKQEYKDLITQLTILLDNFRYQPNQVKLMQYSVNGAGISLIYHNKAIFYIYENKFEYQSLIDTQHITSNYVDCELIKAIVLNIMNQVVN